MNNILYFIVGIVSFIIVSVILNRSKTIMSGTKPIEKKFINLLIFSLVFFLLDISWGICEYALVNKPIGFLYILTYCILGTYAFISFLWFKFTIYYLSKDLSKNLFLVALPYIFMLTVFILLITNYYEPVIFSFDTNAAYDTLNLRFMLIFLMIINYVIMLFIALTKYFQEENFRLYSGTAIVFSIIPIVTLSFQYYYPELPFFTIGLLISNFTIYAFIVTQEQIALVSNSKKMEIELEHKKILQTDYSIINSLSDKYEFICIVNSEKNTITNYRVSSLFGKYIDENEKNISIETFENAFHQLIPKTEIDDFIAKSDRDSILLTLKSGKNYGFSFNIVYEHVLYHYKIKFSQHLEQPACVIISIKNITDQMRERREKEDALYRASIDGLTGLLNKTTFVEKTSAYLNKHDSNNTTFIYFDIDNFKMINDELGHSKGDEILQSVADKIKTYFDANCLIARLGGDEYGIFIPDNKKYNLNETIKNMYVLLSQTVCSGDKSIVVSCSIGCVNCLTNGHNYSSLHDIADETMYKIKKNGKNGYLIKEITQ